MEGHITKAKYSGDHYVSQRYADSRKLDEFDFSGNYVHLNNISNHLVQKQNLLKILSEMQWK